MRKSMLICLLSAICLTLFTACVDIDKGENTATQSPVITADEDISPEDDPFALVTNNEDLTAEPFATTNEEQTSETTATPNPVDSEPASETDETTSTDSVVIAESSNTVSDKEKQEVLDDLSRELDEILKGIGDMEDMDDSDLNPGNIE